MGYSPKSFRASWLVRYVAVVGWVLSLGMAGIGQADLLGGRLTDASRATLASTIGNPDPALPHRLAHALGTGQQVAAFYSGTRLERLAALDAALVSRDAPFEILPSLAALMGANDRQVASRAAHALHTILSREMHTPSGSTEVVPGQKLQLQSQLIPLISDHRLDLDIRGVAFQAVERLSRDIDKKARTWLKPLLKDRDNTIRIMAVGMLEPPLDEGALALLVGMSAEDADPLAKGNAAAMLCENALAHGVKKPSDDLAKILKKTMGDPTIPVSAIGSILSCLKQFEGPQKADLIDQAMAHPDPGVKEFLKAQKIKSR